MAKTETKRTNRKFTPEERIAHVRGYKEAKAAGQKAVYLKKHKITASHISRWGDTGPKEKTRKNGAKRKNGNGTGSWANILWICDGVDRGILSAEDALQQVRQVAEAA